MKILIPRLWASMENALATEFRALGHQVLDPCGTASKWPQHMRDMNADVFLLTFGSVIHHNPDIAHRIRQVGRLVMTEHAVPASWNPERAKAECDLYYSSYQDGSSHYMPLACNDHTHLNRGPREGAILISRGSTAPRRIELALKIRTQIQGRFQLKSNIPDKTYDDRFEIFANKKVAIGIWTVDNGVPLRYFEALGSGALLLTLPFPAWRKHATPGEHYIESEDLGEALDWIESHEEEAAEIARQGWAHVMANHTWRHRAQRILDDLARIGAP